MKKKIKKSCKICKKYFFVSPCRNKSKFCSRKCYVKEWVTRVPGWNKGKKLHYDVWNKGKKLPQFSGKNSSSWKGGRDISHGYVRLQINGEAILEHRFIMEKKLNRKLESWEVVHHKNGIKTDNRLRNLQLLSRGKHTSLHHLGVFDGSEDRRCINCKKTFRTYFSNNGVFCNKKCYWMKRAGKSKKIIYKNER